MDADYQVKPNFLSDLVGHFSDPAMGFVQTPQDYRDGESRGRFGRAMYLSYWYFFAISMVTRNEYNSIIFGGTMGLILREPLVAAGGWDEWCITEDAEVSVRILDLGYKSLYVHESYGHGVMPLDYAGLKKQRFRWAFGGMQILRMHFKRLLGFSGGKLTWPQRFAYLSGGLQWLNDLLAFMFTIILATGAGVLALGGSFHLQPLAGAAMLMPLLFVFFAVFRFLWAFRVRVKCTWSDAFDSVRMLLGLTWVVMLACVRGLSCKEGVFLRTPKQGDRPKFREVVRVVSWEFAISLICVLIALVLATASGVPLMTRFLLTMLLLWQAFIYGNAFSSSFWSYQEMRIPKGESSPRRKTAGQLVGDIPPGGSVSEKVEYEH